MLYCCVYTRAFNSGFTYLPGTRVYCCCRSGKLSRIDPVLTKHSKISPKLLMEPTPFFLFSVPVFLVLSSVVCCISSATMSGIARTVNIFLRSSRTSLVRPTGVNPVLHVFAKDRLAARGLATAFERTKPHVNIGRRLSSSIASGFCD